MGEGEAAVKRSALQITSDSDDDDDEEFSAKALPAKVPKIGFGLGSQMGKKGSAISIKLGATVSIKEVTTTTTTTTTITTNSTFTQPS